MSTLTTLKVRFRTPGFHSWPKAPSGRNYLKTHHRHLFHFQAEAQVQTQDREVEFHDLMRDVKYHLSDLFNLQGTEGLNFDFKDYSCEQIAQELLLAMPALSAVEVWEDGECGARVERSQVEVPPSPIQDDYIPF